MRARQAVEVMVEPIGHILIRVKFQLVCMGIELEDDASQYSKAATKL